jgi:RNA polymerase sigma-70 factor (ECF subfamily)
MSNTSRDALRQFFVLGYDELRTRLARRLGSIDLASDALHETWLRIDSAAPSGPVRSPKHYLLQMASNVARKRLTAEKRFVTLTDAKMAIGLADDTPDPERAAIAQSEISALARAVSELSPRRREILLASRLKNIPLWAIAERMGISQRLVEIELKNAVAHCALRLERKVIKRFGPKAPDESLREEDKI